MSKTRLDLYLAQSGKSRSREKAKREILAGWVRVNGETIRDPAKTVYGNEEITVKRPGGIYVSRGGDKLQRAMMFFNIDLTDAVAVDLGASTGGFTDCMLRAGARAVYAVDVGYGQLDYSLRKDERVIVMERTHVRDLTADCFKHTVDFVTADLSFISIVKVFDKIKLLFSGSEGVILIKPQFEAGPGEHKKGVVRDRSIHIDILASVIERLMEKGLVMKGLTGSPIKGPAGNIEFLLYYSFNAEERVGADVGSIITEAVHGAHREFGGPV